MSALWMLLLACAPPPISEGFVDVQLSLAEGPGAAHAPAIELIDSAEQSLYVALPRGGDLDLADALLAAHERGVEVEIVVDTDRREEEAIAWLREQELDITLADHGVEYFDFSINEDVAWSSEEVRMTHAYVLADRTRLVQASTLGGLEEGTRVVFEARGEDLLDDLYAEHVQMHGGTDAAELTEYSGMAKSITDYRWMYPTTTDVVLEMWFGPQERLSKRVIDQVYGARSSVWILSADLADEGLVRALQAKAELGFDMRVAVGASFGLEEAALADLLRDLAPDVQRVHLPSQDALPPHSPTIVLVDVEPGRDGRLHQPRAMVMTHPLYSAARLYDDGLTVYEVPTDQYTDGAMWVLSDFDEPSDELVQLRDFVLDQLEQGVPL